MDEDTVCETLQRLADNAITVLVIQQELPQSGQIDALLTALENNSSVTHLILDFHGHMLEKRQESFVLALMEKKRPNILTVDFSAVSLFSKTIFNKS